MKSCKTKESCRCGSSFRRQDFLFFDKVLYFSIRAVSRSLIDPVQLGAQGIAVCGNCLKLIRNLLNFSLKSNFFLLKLIG